MNRPGTLRAGLIGLGAMGRNHARVLSQLDGVDFVGACDALVSDQRASHGAPIVPNLDELLALGLDYVVLAAPTYLHEDLGLQLAAARVHALIEKPLAPDPAGARRLVEAFESEQLIAAVGHIERFNPALQALRERLSRGDLGQIYQVVTRRTGPFPARIADVGVVKDLATHDIDLTAWITGQTYARVSAQTSRRSGREHEDLVLVVARMTGDVVAHHQVNWLSPLKERSTVVTGERGCFVADTLTGDLTFYANGEVVSEWESARNFRGVSEGDVTRFALPRREPLLVEHERFRDGVLGLGQEYVTAREGLAVVDVAAAILESAQSHQVVSLAQVDSRQ